MEEWRDIKGYPNYMVSNIGRVKTLGNGKSNASKRERVLKPYKTKDGYLHIDLFNENGRKVFNIHRLVASSFIPNPNNLPEVNHKDEDKSNNTIWVNEDGSIDYNKSNLEWCDRSYNCNYGTHNERMAKALSKPILQFNLDGEFIRRWDSIIQVKRELGFDDGGISKCCKCKLKTAYGFVWMYAVINGFTIDINKLKKVA